MSDTEAKLDFTADDKTAKAAIDRLTKQMAGLEEQQRKLNETSKKGAEAARKEVDLWAAGMDRLSAAGRKVHENISAWDNGMAKLKEQRAELERHSHHQSEIAHWLSEQGKEAIKLGVGFVTIDKAVEGILGSFDKWKEKLTEVANAQRQVSAAVMRSTADAGMLQHTKEIEEFVEKGAGTTEERRQALFGAHAGMPFASLKDKQALAEEVLKYKGTGQDMGQLAEQAGRVQEAGGLSANDAMDMVAMVRSKVGSRANELTDPAFLRAVHGLRKGGMPIERTMAMASLALEQGQRLNFLTDIGAAIEAPASAFEHKGGMHRLTPEERLKEQFGAMGPAERETALLNDRKMREAIVPSADFRLEMMGGPQAIDQLQRQYSSGLKSNFGLSGLQEAQLTRTGLQAASESGIKQQEAEYERKFGYEEGLLSRIRQSELQGAWNQGGGRGAMDYMAMGMTHAFDWMARGMGESALSQIDTSKESNLLAPEVQREITAYLKEIAQNTQHRGGVNINAHNEGGR